MQSSYWKAASSWDKNSLRRLDREMRSRVCQICGICCMCYSPFCMVPVGPVAEKQRSYITFVVENANVRDLF